MSHRIRNIVFLVLLGFLFVEVLIVFPSRLDPSKEEKAAAPVAADMGPDQKMAGVHLVESQRGSHDWELFAEKGEGKQGKENWALSNVRVLFYNKDKVDFTVTGQSGTIDSKDIRIRGKVKTVSVNGYQFETEEIAYDSKSRRILSPGRVEMLGPKDNQGSGLHVVGKKMLVEVDRSKMTIQESIQADKEMTGGKPLSIVSESAEFSGQNKEARFMGQVSMRYERMKLEGPEAIFQYAPGNEGPKAIQFRGGVKVSDVDKFATSENMVMDLPKNQFVFSGRPKVYQNGDELSGEQIIFLEGGKKVKVERVRARVEKPK